MHEQLALVKPIRHNSICGNCQFVQFIDVTSLAFDVGRWCGHIDRDRTAGLC